MEYGAHRDIFRKRRELLPVQHTRRFGGLYADDTAQMGAANTRLRRTTGQFRTKLAQDRKIVRLLVAVGQEQRGDVRLVEHIFQFVQAISWVDVDENGTNGGGSKLQNHPLGPICCPNTDVFLMLDAKPQQGASGAMYFLSKLLPGAAEAQLWKHQRLALGPAFDGAP
ncbi:hypothetical protein HRbin36_01872 [bacterium HR36]|nr:hypothetical protein HRbin36_01872 [bacterium HR36]